MKRARKVKEALKERLAVWDHLVADGFHGSETKLVKHDGKRKAFRRPGSQNARKGSSRRSGK